MAADHLHSAESLKEAAVVRLNRLANLRNELKRRRRQIAEIHAEMAEARADLAEIEVKLKNDGELIPFPTLV